MADVRRRTLLGAMLGALGGVAGCAGVARTVGMGDSVRVAVSWSSTELAAFAAVMAGWGRHSHELIPFGDDIDAALGARTAGRMDVVALPRLGLVADNVGKLERLPDEVWRPEYDRIWGQGQLGGHYALPFKLAHKSVVWYRRAVLSEAVADLGLSGSRTPLALIQRNPLVPTTPLDRPHPTTHPQRTAPVAAPASR